MWNSLITMIAPEQSEQDQLFSRLASGTCSERDLDAFFQSPAGSQTAPSSLVGSGGMTLLHAAALGGNVDVARKLVSQFGLSVSARTANGGNTPAHLAASKGHERMVDFLIVECGASPGAKNSRNQNVFDIAEGLNLRQTLMKLVLQEEIRNGTAPVIAGATQDRTKDIERLKNLPPPPIYAAPPVSAPTASSTAIPLTSNGPSRSYIQPDGFVTTVGNPELAAKYGNQVQTRLYASGPGAGPQQAGPYIPLAPPPAAFQNNTTRARYVTSTPGMDVLGYNVLSSSAPSSVTTTTTTTTNNNNNAMLTSPPQRPRVFDPSAAGTNSAFPAPIPTFESPPRQEEVPSQPPARQEEVVVPSSSAQDHWGATTTMASPQQQPPPAQSNSFEFSSGVTTLNGENSEGTSLQSQPSTTNENNFAISPQFEPSPAPASNSSSSKPTTTTIQELMAFIPNLAQYMPPGWLPPASS